MQGVSKGGIVLVAFAAPPHCRSRLRSVPLRGSEIAWRPGSRLMPEAERQVDALLAPPCNGDIANKNGKLVCKPGPNPFTPPPGSSMQKCNEVSIAGRS